MTPSVCSTQIDQLKQKGQRGGEGHTRKGSKAIGTTRASHSLKAREQRGTPGLARQGPFWPGFTWWYLSTVVQGRALGSPKNPNHQVNPQQ